MAVDASKPVLQTISRYDLFEKIAEGGMGTVYKARERDSGQVVAIKVVPPQVAKNPVLMKRFEQEYNVASSLNHPNMVRALDFGCHDSTPYLVMEFVDGESLGQKIERDGKIAESDAIKIIAQVAQGLHKAHKQGLIHRDVKPDNVLVTADGTAKLADLGLVKELETDLNLTRTGRGLGTPHFMAPEQFRNAKNADARCDIYSLAATLYNMVTGELPFVSSGPLDAWMKKINNELVPARNLVPALSERLDWALRRALSVDRDQRPATCREFVEDLTGRSTRKLTASAEIPVSDIWYLVYTDDETVTHTVKGTLQGIRRSLKEGVLGDASNIRAARGKSGPFELLRNHPEFRDLVLPLQVTPPAQVAPKNPVKSPPPTPRPPAPPPPPKSRAEAKLSHAAPRPRQFAEKRPRANSDTMVPLIQLVPEDAGLDWLKWVALLFCAGGLAAAGYFILPVLMR
jgi:serine/threonine protein kinase